MTLREQQLTQPSPGPAYTHAEEAARQNEIQRRLEDRARTEANTGDRPFCDWLADNFDVRDLADIVCNLIDATADSQAYALRRAETHAAAYVAWRTHHASAEEVAGIEEAIAEEKEEM